MGKEHDKWESLRGNKNAVKEQKGVKKSLNLSPTTTAWVMLNNDYAAEKIQWSIPINESVSHLQYLIKINLPELNKSEWAMIINAYSDCKLPAFQKKSKTSIANDLMSSLGVIDINNSSEEIKAFVNKLHSLSETETLAIRYVTQIYSLKKWGNQSLESIIEEIKSSL